MKSRRIGHRKRRKGCQPRIVRRRQCLLELFEEKVLLTGTSADAGDFDSLVELRAEGESDSSISGFVYLDVNGDGVRDAGDVGVPGALITLEGNDSSGEAIRRTAITLNSGFYQFEALDAGTYQIRQAQPQALVDGSESTPADGATTQDDQFSNVVLGDSQVLSDNNFAEARLLPEYLTISWFFASSDQGSVFREIIAQGEEQAGNTNLAARIRDEDTALDSSVVTNDDSYEVIQGSILSVNVPEGILANDIDTDGDVLTAVLVDSTTNGRLTFNADGSFRYIPDSDFVGTDEFTYTATDGETTSVPETVTIVVNPLPNAFSVAENSPAETVVGTIIAPVSLGDSLAFEVDDPSIPTELKLLPDDHLAGEPAAEVVLIEYLDFACPACAALQPTIMQLEQTFSEELLVVRRFLPLTFRPNAFPAARVAEAAGRQGMFDEMSNLLFDNQDQWVGVTDPQPIFETFASDLGLDLNLFQEDLNDPGIDDRINRDANSAASLGANATPTLFLNGEQIDVPASVDAFSQLVQAEIDEADESFRINRVTGEVSVSGLAPLDFETTSSFTIPVSVANLSGNREVVDVDIAILDVNEAPVSATDSYEVNQASSLVIDVAAGVLANDTDDDGDPLTVVLLDGPSGGQLTLEDDGAFVYVPEVEFTGTDQFTYQARDAALSSSTTTVTINVIDINLTPDATADFFSTDEDIPLQIDAATGVLANDSDGDGDMLSARLVTSPDNGTLEFNSDGSFVYTPEAEFSGSDSFRYEVSDGELASTAEVTITIDEVNDPPTATADAYSIDEDDTLTIDAAAGLLANDTDPESSQLSVASFELPTNGSLDLSPDGSFIYTPAADFFGDDAFTYTVTDGNSTSEVATVSITVNPVNDDAPVAQDDAYSIPVDGVIQADADVGVLANDTDVDGDDINAALLDDPGSGTLLFNADGSFEYTPDAGFHGVDSFTYSANDGLEDSNVATVTILVNSAPMVQAEAYQIDEDAVLQVEAVDGVLANDMDVDGDPLEINLVTQTASGSLVLTLDGAFVYTPDPNFNGVDTFTYMLNDGFVDSLPVTVEITVQPVNDVPVAEDDSYLVPVDGTLIVDVEGGLGNNDSDADGQTLTTTVATEPGQGTLMLNADGSFAYTPNPGFHGIDSFTYQASDGAETDEATVTIEVNSVPTVDDANFATDEDVVLAVNVPGLLDNVDDIDGDVLEIILMQDTVNGMLTINQDGSFEYIPQENFNGSDSFSYVVNDGFRNSEVATVSLTINAVNDLPQATADTYEVDEDITLTIPPAMGLLANDTDVESATLTVRLVQRPANGSLNLNGNGAFFYGGSPNFNGVDSFTYVANDGTDDSAEVTVTINVRSVNDIPQAGADSYSVDEDSTLNVDAAAGILANDSDVETADLDIRLVQDVTNGTLSLNADGSFSYVPDANFDETDSFTYVVNDGMDDSAETMVTITVNPINDAPVVAGEVYFVDPGTDLIVDVASGLLANDVDVDDELTVVVDSVAGSFFGGTGVNPDGSFFYGPNDGFLGGQDSFAYRVTDGTVVSDLVVVTINLNSDVPLPATVPDSYSIEENGTLEVPAEAGVLANDVDPEGDTLFANVIPGLGPNNGTLSFDNGAFTYTPNPGFSGMDSFQYHAVDGSTFFSATSSIATEVVITVVPRPAGEGEPVRDRQETELSGLAWAVDELFADDDDDWQLF